MMQQIETIEQLHTFPAEVRSKRKGFLTNFYLDEVKHSLWIQKGVLAYEWISDTLFIVKKSETFWNVFYCTTLIEELATDLAKFKSEHSEKRLIFDIVGREAQCTPMAKLFEEQGFREATSLVRMTRMTEQMEYIPDNTIVSASLSDVPVVHNLLHQYFDEKTEQIPFFEELETYAKEGQILICKKEGQIAGFLIYKINASTLYLRYWFTHPDFRDQKIGSRLLRRFFEEGKETKRQIFWVIRSNENAIKRYRHYGFTEENMFDFVMECSPL